jgi:hypothetical protein
MDGNRRVHLSYIFNMLLLLLLLLLMMVVVITMRDYKTGI